MKRILVVELWNIGDVILTLPFLAQLRAKFPGADITLLGQPHAKELLAGTGLVDQFIEAELTWKTERRRFNPLAYDWAELIRIIRIVRSRKFDLAFQCRPHVREYVVLALSGARRRVGYARPGWRRALTDALSFGDSDLQVKDAWLRLLEPFGATIDIDVPELSLSKDEQTWASEFLRTMGLAASKRLVGIHPGASVPEKRWPIERFQAVVHDLAARNDCSVVAFVGPDGYGASLGRVDGVTQAKVELRQMMALLARCDLLVCNDSGPMHVAGALGVPTVAVFGSGIDRRFAPLGSLHEAVVADPLAASPFEPGAPAGPYDDVSSVPTSRVLEAVDRRLRAAPTNAPGTQQARILLNHGRR